MRDSGYLFRIVMWVFVPGVRKFNDDSDSRWCRHGFRVQSLLAHCRPEGGSVPSSRVTSSNVLTHCQRRLGCQWPGLFVGTTEIYRGSLANTRQDTSSLGTRGYVELQSSKVLKRELSLRFGSVLQSIYGDHAVRLWHSKARNSTDDSTIRYEVLLRWAELSQAFLAEQNNKFQPAFSIRGRPSQNSRLSATYLS